MDSVALERSISRRNGFPESEYYSTIATRLYTRGLLEDEAPRHRRSVLLKLKTNFLFIAIGNPAYV